MIYLIFLLMWCGSVLFFVLNLYLFITFFFVTLARHFSFIQKIKFSFLLIFCLVFYLIGSRFTFIISLLLLFLGSFWGSPPCFLNWLHTHLLLIFLFIKILSSNCNLWFYFSWITRFNMKLSFSLMLKYFGLSIDPQNYLGGHF